MYAAQSSLHGSGAFARKDLKAGSVAVLYPVHVIGEGGSVSYCHPADRAVFRVERSEYRLNLEHYPLVNTIDGTWIEALPEIELAWPSSE